MRIGNLNLAGNLLLAPLAGYTDLAFRLVVRACTQNLPAPGAGDEGTAPSYGVALAFTELLCSDAVVAQTHRTLTLAATHGDDQPLGMQLYGRDAQVLGEAARWACAHGAALIDINMGCPVDKVTKRNGGSKLLCEPDHAVALAGAVVKAVEHCRPGTPVTCKIRLGWDDTCLVGPSLAPKLADVGVAAVTVHGRTTEQMFRGNVRLSGIAQVVEAVKRHHPGVPVIGNGDVKTPQDARHMLAATGCDGVMIGRGALGQPWIFRDTAYTLATGTLPPPLPRHQRAALVLQHFENMLTTSADSDLERRQRHALNQIKQRMSWYSAQLQPWPGLRRDVQLVQSAAEFRAFMAPALEPSTPSATPMSTPPRPAAQHRALCEMSSPGDAVS